MKKSLVIAMCCITVLCAACKKEKPYEKFVGDYKGNCLIDPTITMDNPLIPGQTITQNLDDITIPMEVTLSAGDADDRIVMTYQPEGQDRTYSFYGTIKKNDVVEFGTVSINETFEGYTINANVANMTGTLVNTTFSINGTVNGTGSTLLFDTPITMTGSMNAVLNKVINAE